VTAHHLPEGLQTIRSMPMRPTPLPLDLTRPNPRMGIERIVWSPSGRWCAVTNGESAIQLCARRRFPGVSSFRSASAKAKEMEKPKCAPARLDAAEPSHGHRTDRLESLGEMVRRHER
jgi:hypothetical protein